MYYVITLKQDSTNTNLHETILSTIDALRFDLDAIYFMDKAASLCHKDNNLIDEYIKKAKEYNIELFVCGRALKECNIQNDAVLDNITITGYTELSINLSKAKYVLSF